MQQKIVTEQAVIGGAFLTGGVDVCIKNGITPDCFGLEQHKKLYKLIFDTHDSGKAVDPVTVAHDAAEIFGSQQDGVSYVMQCVQNCYSIDNLQNYCTSLKAEARRRRAGELLGMAAEKLEAGEDIIPFLSEMAENEEKKQSELVHIYKYAENVYAQMAETAKEQETGKKSVISTGFGDLDRMLDGLKPSNLVILAARPAMGKTAFALNLARNVAKSGKKVAFFSLEMSGEELAMRILSAESHVSQNTLKSGILTEQQWRAFATGMDAIYKMQMFVDDSGKCTIGNIRQQIKKMDNLGLVVADHLGLIDTGNAKFENRVAVISDFTRKLKQIAKEFQVPVLLLSQLNRAVEARTDKRPILSDLRESGSIEQDADSVLMLYREAYYSKDENPSKETEVIVAKNRHGTTGTAKVFFSTETCNFYEEEV